VWGVALKSVHTCAVFGGICKRLCACMLACMLVARTSQTRSDQIREFCGHAARRAFPYLKMTSPFNKQQPNCTPSCVGHVCYHAITHARNHAHARAPIFVAPATWKPATGRRATLPIERERERASARSHPPTERCFCCLDNSFAEQLSNEQRGSPVSVL